MLNKAFYSILLKNTFQIVIVCIGVSTPSKRPPAYFLPSPPPSKPPFLRNSPSILVFRESSLKVGFFSEPQTYQSFSSLTPSYLLKVTKFLVEISQFEFVVMTEENIFGHKLFLLLNISDFDLCENCNSSPWIYQPLLSQQTPSKTWGPVKPPTFLKIWLEVKSLPSRKVWVHTMIV